MKFGTQLGSLGRKDVHDALRYAHELGCQGLEVDLPVAALGTGQVTLDGLLADAATLRQAFEAAGIEFISLTPGIMLKSVRTPATCTARTGPIASKAGAGRRHGPRWRRERPTTARS